MPLPDVSGNCTNPRQITECSFPGGDNTHADILGSIKLPVYSNVLRSKVLGNKTVQAENSVTENSHNPRRTPVLPGSTTTSNLFFSDSYDNKMTHEKLKQQEEIIRYQKSVINQMKLQLEQLTKEVSALHHSFNHSIAEVLSASVVN